MADSVCVRLLFIVMFAGLTQIDAKCSKDKVDDLIKRLLDDLWRFEDTGHKDHAQSVGVKDLSFNTTVFRVDGIIGDVITTNAFEHRIFKYCPDLKPFYQGFDEAEQRHFLTLDVTKLGGDAKSHVPLAYCSATEGYCGATEALHGYTAKLTDHTGKTGTDSYYTADECDMDEPGRQNYTDAGILCYIWGRPETKQAGDKLKSGEEPSLRQLYSHLIPIYNFYNAKAVNHYLQPNLTKPEEFLDVIMYLIKPSSYEEVKKSCPDLVHFYDYLYTYNNGTDVNNEVVIDDKNLKYKQDGHSYYSNFRLLGYASPRKGYCSAHLHLQDLFHSQRDDGTDIEFLYAHDYESALFTDSELPKAGYSPTDLSFFAW